jgi:hypothetical protein
MPAQSRLLPVDGYSGLDLIPFISENHPDAICYALENSLLTMSLHSCHLHCASDADDLFSLNFQLATGLWFTLKYISRTIQLAANPLLDPFRDIPGTLDPELLDRICMPFPAVLSIKKYTQNLLIVMSTWVEVCCLFGIAQKASLDGAQWIQMARERCSGAKDNLGWDWSKSGNGPTYSVNFPKSVNCGYIESIADSDEPNNSKALILHLTLSTYAQEHPNFNQGGGRTKIKNCNLILGVNWAQKSIPTTLKAI